MWGTEWDSILDRDTEGLLVKRMGELVDGEYQKLVVSSGAYAREHFFGSDPRLLQLVQPLSDEELRRLRLGGHDPRKVYAAYKAATEHKGAPTVILARTIKGYGLGEAGEGKNVTHQQKKLNEEELREFRSHVSWPTGRTVATSRSCGTRTSTRWISGIILHGSPRKAQAMQLLQYMKQPENEVRLPLFIATGLSNKQAIAALDGPFKKDTPSNPDNLRNALQLDARFWMENGDSLTQRFNAWAAK